MLFPHDMKAVGVAWPIESVVTSPLSGLCCLAQWHIRERGRGNLRPPPRAVLVGMERLGLLAAGPATDADRPHKWRASSPSPCVPFLSVSFFNDTPA